jgi:hypothetical protein
VSPDRKDATTAITTSLKAERIEISQARALFLHVAATPSTSQELRETNGLFPVFVVPETCATRKLFGSEQVPAQAQPFPQPRRCFFRICSRGSALRGHGSEEKVQSRLKVESGWLAMGSSRCDDDTTCG